MSFNIASSLREAGMAVRRALIIRGGAMRGAFFVGAMKSVYRLLGTEYFDAVFSTSVGIFEQTFFASRQPETMEHTWREYVCGTQLVNLLNPLRGRPVLDLDYLINLFRSDKSLLDLESLSKSKMDLFTFVADHQTGAPVAVNLKENNIFDLMRAACALPVLYPRKVIINGRRYVDVSLAPKGALGFLLKNILKEFDDVLAIIGSKEDSCLNVSKIIRPSKMPLYCGLDTDRERIIKTIEQGEADADIFIRNNYLCNKC